MVKKAYVVLTHHSVPNKHARNPNEAWIVSENCEFVTTLKNKHNTQSTLILDYVNRTIVKTRSPELTFTDFDSYLKKKYPEKMVMFLHIVDGTPIEDMVVAVDDE